METDLLKLNKYTIWKQSHSELLKFRLQLIFGKKHYFSICIDIFQHSEMFENIVQIKSFVSVCLARWQRFLRYNFINNLLRI